jgi:hypothetical protein
MNPKSKPERFDAVETSILELIARDGVDRLTISKISKRAKVSRAWIYKNLGGDLESIILHAAKSIGRTFAELEQSWRPVETVSAYEQSRQGAISTLRAVERFPWIPEIYFQNLGKKGPIGEVIREIEAGAVKKMETVLNHVYGLDEVISHSLAVKTVKTRMVLVHAWIHQPGFRDFGEAGIIEMMLPVPKTG